MTKRIQDVVNEFEIYGIHMSAQQREFHRAAIEAASTTVTCEILEEKACDHGLEIIYLYVDDLLVMGADKAREALKQPYDVLVVSRTSREWFGHAGATRLLEHLHKTDPKNASREDINDSEDDMTELEDMSEQKQK